MSKSTISKKIFLSDIITEHIKTLDVKSLSEMLQHMILETSGMEFVSLIKSMGNNSLKHSGTKNTTIPIAVPVKKSPNKKEKRKRPSTTKTTTKRKKRKIDNGEPIIANIEKCVICDMDMFGCTCPPIENFDNLLNG